MSAELTAAQSRLKDFKQRHSPSGLFSRYAKRRRANFAARQGFVLVLLSVLLATGQTLWCALSFGIILIGEALDCGFLAYTERQGISSEKLSLYRLISTLTATLQMMCFISIGFAVTLNGTSPYVLTLCLIALTAGGINSAFDIRFHRGAAYARLAVIFIIAVLLSLLHMYRQTISLSEGWYLVFAIAISSFTVNSFRQYIANSFKTQVARERAILQQSHKIARVGFQLAESQKENRNLALVAKHANDSVIISDADRRIIWVNEAFTRMTGYPAREAIGQNPAALLNGPNTSQECSDSIGAALKQALPIRVEILNQTKDGNEIWVETNQMPIKNEAGEVETVIAIERNITAAKAHERELDAARHTAEEGERAKAQFLATMSHEIRTPMNGIIGMADLLSDTAMTREHRNYVETIKFSAEALLRIINDILDFSKFDAGKLIITPKDFDLLACIESAFSILRPKAIEKSIFVDLDCKTPVPEVLRGDDGRIRQILINIIGNAIKFTQNGGVTLQLSSTPRADGYTITIAVKDTGIGIHADQLTEIFDEFSQADSDTTRKFGGTGLGLTISRLLAREMGGDITVSSKPGHGSVFTITLHLDAASPEASLARENESQMPLDLRLPHIKVLVAEDNKTNQLLIKTYLKNTEMELLFADNGIEAVTLAKRHSPQLIFMDMSMPELDGIEATRAIRKADMPQPKIIALTANVYASDKAACLNAGMDGFLSKPLKRSDLMSFLSTL